MAFHRLLIHSSGKNWSKHFLWKEKSNKQQVDIQHLRIINILKLPSILKLCKQTDIIKSDIKKHLNPTNQMDNKNQTSIELRGSQEDNQSLIRCMIQDLLPWDLLLRGFRQIQKEV